ncbi:MAG TPA: hypothetical protein VH833_00560 [Gemmatimonadales bacterium]|jgi:hypothetical protein
MLKPLGIILVIVTALAAPVTLPAQNLPAGTWTGTMSPPTDAAVPVTFEVSGSGDSLAISMVLPTGQRAPFNELRLADGKLLFQWAAGPTIVKCDLAKQESGGFKGPCTDSEGMTGQIEMVPPTKP